jgi:hypothetical protein
MQAKRQGDVRKGGAGLDDLADVAAGLPPAATLRKISKSTGKKSAQEVERPAKLPGIPGIPKAKGKSAPNNSKQQEGRGVVRNKGSSNVARDAAGDRLNLPSGPFSPRPGNKRPSMNSPEGEDNNDKKRPAASKVSAEKTSKGKRSQVDASSRLLFSVVSYSFSSILLGGLRPSFSARDRGGRRGGGGVPWSWLRGRVGSSVPGGEG